MNYFQFDHISFTIYFRQILDSTLLEAIYAPENWGQAGTIQANGKVFSLAGNVNPKVKKGARSQGSTSCGGPTDGSTIGLQMSKFPDFFLFFIQVKFFKGNFLFFRNHVCFLTD